MWGKVSRARGFEELNSKSQHWSAEHQVADWDPWE